MIITLKEKIKSLLINIFANALIIWHLAAIITAPAPNSVLVDSIYGIVEKYVKIFHLFNGWAYFAPNPKMNGFIHYKIIAEDNREHIFYPLKALTSTSASFFRHVRMYDNLAYNFDHYSKGFATYIFRKHKDLKPKIIHIFVSFQEKIPPAEYLKGFTPLDKVKFYKDYKFRF